MFLFFVVLSVVLSCSVTHVFGQLDTEFWFVAPEVWDGHGDDPILLRFNLGDPAQVTVEQPANPAFPVQTLNIPANGTQTLDLTPWLGDIENKPSNTTLDRGLHITSDAPVTAYYEINHNPNPDIFALKGSSALGDAFTYHSRITSTIITHSPRLPSTSSLLKTTPKSPWCQR